MQKNPCAFHCRRKLAQLSISRGGIHDTLARARECARLEALALMHHAQRASHVPHGRAAHERERRQQRRQQGQGGNLFLVGVRHAVDLHDEVRVGERRDENLLDHPKRLLLQAGLDVVNERERGTQPESRRLRRRVTLQGVRAQSQSVLSQRNDHVATGSAAFARVRVLRSHPRQRQRGRSPHRAQGSAQSLRLP